MFNQWLEETGGRAARLDWDRHFDVLIEPVEHRDKAVDCEAREFCLADGGEVRRGKTGQLVSAANAQSLFVEHRYDLGGEGLEGQFR
jgi:hypothetical protein